MKNLRDRMTPERAAWLTRFASIVLIIVFALSTVSLGAVALVANSNASREEARTKSLRLESERIGRVLEEASTNQGADVENQSRAVAAFQESVTHLAQGQKCHLSEFLASTDLQPFVTRFAKQADTSGWNQVETQITLIGSASNVFRFIRSLSTGSIPVEFNSINLTREELTENGSTIKAKLQLRVLVQAGGAKA